MTAAPNTTTTKPSVLFVCVHNAGRSQMAAGYLTELSGGRIEVRSAGSEPADQINPVAVEAIKLWGKKPPKDPAATIEPAEVPAKRLM